MFFEFAVLRKQMMAGPVPEEMARQLRVSRESPLALTLAPRRVFWQLAMGGVFDRHPGLKICFTEVRADWLPETLVWLDDRFAAERIRTQLKPSDYFRRQAYVCPSSPRPTEVAIRDRIGVERFLFGIDYPHPEGTWPNTLEWLRAVFAGVPEAEVRAILGENAVRCYGLDAARLRAVADRIGLEAERLFAPAAAPKARVLEHFDVRAGYARPAETFDAEILDRTFAADLPAPAA
jgi:hypothetical protein